MDLELSDQIDGLLYLMRGRRVRLASEGSVQEVWAGLDPAAVGVIDPQRVVIKGWSYGGYMSLMAIARFPDIFLAAVPGAPVTDWRLYDTAYTEVCVCV